MSAVNNITKMLDSVGAKYKKTETNRGVTVSIPVPGGGYDVDVQFSNGGKDFHTATVVLDGEFRSAQVSDSPTSTSDDYATIVSMVKDAPVKKGSYEEAKSQDGKYIGLLYQDNDCEYGVAFICLAGTCKFLGIVGY